MKNRLECFSQESLFGKSAIVLLFLVTFFVPLAVGYLPLQGGTVTIGGDVYYGFKFAIFSIGVCLAAFFWALDVLWGGKKLHYAPSLYLLLAFLLWMIVCAALSPYPGNAVVGWALQREGALTFLLYGATLFLVLQYIRSEEVIRLLLSVLSASVFLVALYGILQSLGFDPITLDVLSFDGSRSFSTYGNPDMLGGFLALTIPMIPALALTEKKRPMRIALWATFVLAVWCLAASFTRSAWIAVLIALIALAVFTGIKKKKLDGLDWLGIGGALVSSIAVIIKSFSNTVPDLNAASKVSEAVNLSSPNVSIRFEFWRSALSAVAKSPLTGYGPDTYALFFTDFITPITANTLAPEIIVDSPHNYYLVIALGTGIVGLVLFLAFLAWTAFCSARPLFQRKLSRTSLLFFGLWCACAAYLIYVFAGFPIVGSSFIFWIYLGILLVPHSKSVSLGEAFTWKKIVIAPIAIVALLGMAFFGRQFYAGTRADATLNETHATEKIRLLEQASALDPYQLSYETQKAQAYVERGGTAAREYASSGRQEKLDLAFSDYERSADIFTSLTEKYPDYHAGYVNLAALYDTMAEVSGDTAWAEKAIDVAEKATGPDGGPSASAKIQIARAYYLLGEKEKGAALAKELIDRYPGNEQAILLEQMFSGKADTTP